MKATILVVDDNFLDVYVLSKLLRHHSLGCRIVRAHDGQGALEELERLECDATYRTSLAILTDIRMPGMDGLELLAEFESRNSFLNIPVFAFSGAEQPRDEAKARAFPIQNYFVKPLIQRQLVEISDSISQPVLSNA